MNKLRNNIRTIFTVCILAGLVLSCKKDSNDVLSLPRPFTPSTITGTNGETSVKIAWPIALFTTTGQATYTVDISKDVNFTDGTIEFTTTTQDLSVTVTDDKLAIKKDYYARVKTMGINGGTDSNYIVSSSFRITGEQFLNVPGPTDIIDVGVQFTWRTNPDLVKITVTPYTITPPTATPPSQIVYGTPFDVPLNSTDLAANKKIATGLTQLTLYQADIYSATKLKGTVTFKTIASIAGNIVNLTGLSSPTIISTTVASAPSGSTILLGRGEKYVMTGGITIINKSLTFRSALGYGTNYATLLSAGNFTFSNNSTIDSIVFRDMNIKGNNLSAPLSYGTHYVMNVANTGINIAKIRFDNCTIKILRGICRGSGGTAVTNGMTIANYIINNCVIDSIADFSVVQATAFNTFQNVSITKSTIYKARKFINHSGSLGAVSVNISDCTFNEVPSLSGANYFIDYNTNTVTNGVKMLNCIIGQVWTEGGATPATGYRGASSLSLTTVYSTSDFTLISGTSGYSGTSTALFTDPQNGNFLIKDGSFAGRSTTGDPRWRIN